MIPNNGAPLPDGSPASGEGLQSERELVVFGGGIGSSVDVEVSTGDLRGCAGGVRDLAGRVRAATHRVRTAAYVVSVTSDLTSGGPGVVDEAWLVIADGEQRAAGLDDLARRIEAIAGTYDASEAANEARVWSIPRPPWALNILVPWVHLGTAWWLAFEDAWAHGQVLPTRHGAGMAVEETLWALTGRDEPIPPVARALADALALIAGNRMRVVQVDGPAVGTGRGGLIEQHGAVSDIEGVVTALDGLYPSKGDTAPGTVRIDKVTGADGSVSWLVLVPGTQGAIIGDHGSDWMSNPGGMIGDTTASVATVLLAMRQAGIRPGQPVVLAGHSQGGFVALNAANAVADRYDVTGVISVGSPTGLLDAPPEAEVMSIEHVEDPTPGLDNAANPAGENWTVVERDLHTSIDPEIAGITSPAGSHDTPAYVDTARLVDASDEAPVIDFLAEVSDVLDGEATSESLYYQGTRVP